MSQQFIAHTNIVDKVWNNTNGLNAIQTFEKHHVLNMSMNNDTSYPIYNPIMYKTKRKTVN